MVRRHVGIRANPVGFERRCYSKNLFNPCNLHTHPQESELHSTVVASVMIKRRRKTMHTVQTAQAVQLFLFAFFKLRFTYD